MMASPRKTAASVSKLGSIPELDPLEAQCLTTLREAAGARETEPPKIGPLEQAYLAAMRANMGLLEPPVSADSTSKTAEETDDAMIDDDGDYSSEEDEDSSDYSNDESSDNDNYEDEPAPPQRSRQPPTGKAPILQPQLKAQAAPVPAPAPAPSAALAPEAINNSVAEEPSESEHDGHTLIGHDIQMLAKLVKDPEAFQNLDPAEQAILSTIQARLDKDHRLQQERRRPEAADGEEGEDTKEGSGESSPAVTVEATSPGEEALLNQIADLESCLWMSEQVAELLQSEAKADKKRWEKEMKQTKMHLETMKAQVKAREEEIAARDRKCESLAKKAAQLEEDLGNLESTLTEKHSEELDEMIKHTKILHDQIVLGKKENEQLQDIVERMKQERSSLAARVEEFENLVGSLTETLNEKEADIASRDASLVAKATEIQQLQERLDTTASQVGESQDDTLAALMEQISSLELRLSETKEESERRAELLSRSEEEKSQYRTKVEHLECEIADLKGKLQEEATAVLHEDTTDKLREQLASLESSLNESRLLNEELQVAASQVALEKQRSQAQIQELKAQLDTLRDDQQQKSKLSKLNAQLSQQVAHLVSDNDALKANASRAKEEKEAFESELHHLREELEALGSEEQESVHDVLQAKEDKIAELCSFIEFSEQEIVKLQDRLSDAEEEKEALQLTISSMESKLSSLAAKQLEQQGLKEAQAERDELQRQLHNLREELDQSREAQEALQSRLSQAEEAKGVGDNKVAVLELELVSLRYENQAKDEQIRAKISAFEDGQTKMQALLDKIASLEGRLAERSVQETPEGASSVPSDIDKQLEMLTALIQEKDEKMQIEQSGTTERILTSMQVMSKYVETLESRLLESKAEAAVLHKAAARLRELRLHTQHRSVLTAVMTACLLSVVVGSAIRYQPESVPSVDTIGVAL